MVRRAPFLWMLLGSLCAWAADEGSWKSPLRDKANVLQEVVVKRHNIDGLYPSIVRIEEDGSVDFTTSGDANVAHSVNWTSYYLCGQILRYQLTKDPQVHEWVKTVWHGIRRLHTITGVPGLLCRGYVKGHGPSYEERADPNETRWKQGKGEFSEYRWRGHPSHHTYSGALRAYGMVFDFIDDETCREEARQDLEAIGRYAFLDNDMIIKTEDGEVSCNLMLWPPPHIASTRSLMILGELTVIYHATQNPAIKEYMEKTLDKFQIRQKWSKASVAEIVEAFKMNGGVDHDDSDHCFGHLYNLMRIEKDPELREYYLKFADAMWEAMKDDRMALFNFVYETMRPGQGRVEDGLWWLQNYPTLRVFQPKMNSLRQDLPSHPLPLWDRPFDNEYEFKGNPRNLDGWLSRIVTGVRVSPDDPEVVYAWDEDGFLYRSFDGGSHWQDSYLGLAGAPVRQVAVSGEQFNKLIAATDQGAFLSWDSGTHWTRLGEGEVGQKCFWALLQEGQPERAVLLTDRGLFAGAWRGRQFAEWKKLADLPWDGQQGVVCAERTGEAIWTGQGSRIWKIEAATGACEEKASIPESGPESGPESAPRVVLSLSVGPGGRLFALTGTLDRGKKGKQEANETSAYLSNDEGKSWKRLNLPTPQTWAIVEDWDGSGGMVAAGEKGVSASEDGGVSWQEAKTGLDIPVVRSLIPCSTRGVLYAGTLAGLFATSDRGRTWDETSLVLQFEGCLRRECGPGDYLYAYWMGKYHGFVSEEGDGGAPRDAITPPPIAVP